MCIREPRVPGRVKCFGCLKKMRSASASLYFKLKAKGICTTCKKAPAVPGITRCEECRGVSNAATKRYSAAIRNEVLTHYSFGKPLCRCCGTDEPCYLTVDHVDDDGAEHRRREKGSTNGNRLTGMYRKIILGGFVERLQVLCWNCQWAKRLNGGRCPIRGINLTKPPTRDEIDQLRRSRG